MYELYDAVFNGNLNTSKPAAIVAVLIIAVAVFSMAYMWMEYG